jgi:hypothetical protein
MAVVNNPPAYSVYYTQGNPSIQGASNVNRKSSADALANSQPASEGHPRYVLGLRICVKLFKAYCGKCTRFLKGKRPETDHFRWKVPKFTVKVSHISVIQASTVTQA